MILAANDGLCAMYNLALGVTFPHKKDWERVSIRNGKHGITGGTLAGLHMLLGFFFSSGAPIRQEPSHLFSTPSSSQPLWQGGRMESPCIADE